MPEIVTNENECLLYGTRFPVLGTVRRTLVDPFPPKLVIGDYTRADKIIESEYVMSQYSGGLGILYAEMPRHADRYWDGDLEARFRYLTLGAEIVKASDTGPADFLVDFNERLYFTQGPLVYRWNAGLSELELLTTLPSGVTATAVFDGKLWLLTTTSLHSFDGSTWGNFLGDDTTWHPGGFAMCEWDDKLFVLGNDNLIRWSISPDDAWDAVNLTPVNWEVRGKLQLPPGYCRQLIVYFDLAGEAAIHAITRVGVFGYSFASSKFYVTPLTYPTTQTAGQGADIFRGELFVPAGSSGYKYNGSTIENVAPAKDDGLPPELRGDILRFVGGHAFIYAILNAVPEQLEAPPSNMSFFDPLSETPEVVIHDQLANPLNIFPMFSTASRGAVMASPGVAWHRLSGSEAGSQMGAALIASVDETFRLWFTNATGLYYMDLSTGLHNPLQNPASRYRQTGMLETPWVNLGWAEMTKLALGLDVESSGCSETEKIRFLVAWNEEDVWETLGEVTTNGSNFFEIEADAGRPFRSIRFRIEMERGDDNTKTPVLKSAILNFLRRPKKVNGWEMQLNLTDDYEGLTAEELINRLDEIADDEHSGPFVFHDDEGTLRQAKVVISSMSGAELTGFGRRGRYQVSVVELRGNR